MNLTAIYEGPTPFAQMLRDELARRGVAAVVHAVGPFLGIIADAVQTPFSRVSVGEVDLAERGAEIEECLAFVREAPEPLDEDHAETLPRD